MIDGVIAPAREVKLSSPALRRLHRLSVRAELAAELSRQTQVALQEMLLEVFEEAGLQSRPSDQFSIDWSQSTVTLRPQEDRHDGRGA